MKVLKTLFCLLVVFLFLLTSTAEAGCLGLFHGNGIFGGRARRAARRGSCGVSVATYSGNTSSGYVGGVCQPSTGYQPTQAPPQKYSPEQAPSVSGKHLPSHTPLVPYQPRGSAPPDSPPPPQ